MPYGFRGRHLWALPLLLERGGAGFRPGPPPAVRRARARLKTRRALANLRFDSVAAVLDELERSGRWRAVGARQVGTGPRAELGGGEGLRQQWRSAVADRIAEAAEAWESGDPRFARRRGLSQARGSALADYDV